MGSSNLSGVRVAGNRILFIAGTLLAAAASISAARADSQFSAFSAALGSALDNLACRLAVCAVDVSNRRFITTRVQITNGDQPAYLVKFNDNCGVTVCPTAVFLKGPQGWSVVVEGNHLHFLPSTTNGVSDAATASNVSAIGRSSSAEFRWTGSKYEERPKLESTSPTTQPQAQPATLSEKDIKFVQEGCQPVVSYSYVKGKIPYSLEIASMPTMFKVLGWAADFAKRHCAASGIGNLGVIIEWEVPPSCASIGFVPPCHVAVEAQNKNAQTLEWRYRNHAAQIVENDRMAKQKAIEREAHQRQAQIQAQQQEQQRQQQAQQRLALLEAKRAFRERLKAEFGVSKFVPIENLRTNAFTYKGEIIGVTTTFKRMINDGVALFDDLVIDRVPNTLYVQPAYTLLVIKVSGMRQVPELGGISLASATFVSGYICKEMNCSDLLD